MKKFLVLVFVMAFAMVFLAACGNGAPAADTAAPADGAAAADGAAPAPAPAEGDVSMRFGWWGNPVRNEHTTAVLGMFMEENPNISIEEIQAGWADYWPMLLTLAPANDLPDIIQNDWGRIQEFVDNGLLVDLQPFIDDGTINLADVPEAVVESGRVSDSIYGISIGQNSAAMIYNQTLLEELGLEAPRNFTLEEFIDLSRTVYEMSGVRTNWAFADPSNQMEVHLRAQGVVMLTPEGMGGAPENYVEFFETVRMGIDEGWHIRAEDIAGRDPTTQDPLVYPPDIVANANLRAWQTPGWSNGIVGLQNEAEEGTVLALTTYPSTDPQTSNFGRASMLLSITTSSDTPLEAARLVDFWINNQAAHEVMLAERGVIPNSVIADAVYDQLSEMSQIQAEYVSWMAEGNSTPVNPPRPEGSAQVIAELVLITEMVATGQLTPEDAAQRFFDFGNSILG